jgi:hypothetical protein
MAELALVLALVEQKELTVFLYLYSLEVKCCYDDAASG